MLPDAWKTHDIAGIHTQIEFFNNVRNYINEYDVNKYDDFVNDFIFEIITLLPNLRECDLGWLNMSDIFCFKFSNYYIHRNPLPSLQINDNYRVTNIGKKYLDVLYTKHSYAKLRMQDHNQVNETKHTIHNILKKIETSKDNYRLLQIDKQLEQIKIELNYL